MLELVQCFNKYLRQFIPGYDLGSWLAWVADSVILVEVLCINEKNGGIKAGSLQALGER